MEQHAKPGSLLVRIVVSLMMLVGGAAIVDFATGFSSGLGLDIRKHAEALGNWLGSADSEAAAAKAKAEREKCEVENRNAVALAAAEYRQAHNGWANCVNGTGIFDDPEVRCADAKTVRLAMKARLDAVKQFSCSG